MEFNLLSENKNNKIKTDDNLVSNQKEDRVINKERILNDPFLKLANGNNENLQTLIKDQKEVKEYEIKSLINEHTTESNTSSFIIKINDLTMFVATKSEISSETYNIYSPKSDSNVKFKIEIRVSDDKKEKVDIIILFEENEAYKSSKLKKNENNNKLLRNRVINDFEDVKLQIKLRIFNFQNKRFLKYKLVECVVSEHFVTINDYIDLEELTYNSQTNPFILRIDIESYGQDEKSSQAKCYDFIGIINEGNTCYMNSIIQILFHLPIVRSLIFKNAFPDKEEYYAVINLQRLFYALMTETSAIRISYMFNVLGLDKKIQHDVHEIFVNLLETIEKVITNFSDNFLGTTEQIVGEKFSDKEFSRKTETFCFIELPINNSKSLIESLENFMAVSYLDGDNQYQVSDDNKYDAKIALQFKKLPPILFIQLKRFDYNFETGELCKVNSRIEYPEKLDMTNYLNEKDSKFSLYGVIVHKGGHHYGHYYCFIKSKDGIWRKFNDNRVSRANLSEVFDSNYGGSNKDFKIDKENEIIIDEEERDDSAYILFYIKDSCYDDIFIDFGKESVSSEIVKFLDKRKTKSNLDAIKITPISNNYNNNNNNNNYLPRRVFTGVQNPSSKYSKIGLGFNERCRQTTIHPDFLNMPKFQNIIKNSNNSVYASKLVNTIVENNYNNKHGEKSNNDINIDSNTNIATPSNNLNNTNNTNNLNNTNNTNNNTNNNINSNLKKVDFFETIDKYKHNNKDTKTSARSYLKNSKKEFKTKVFIKGN